MQRNNGEKSEPLFSTDNVTDNMTDQMTDNMADTRQTLYDFILKFYLSLYLYMAKVNIESSTPDRYPSAK